MANAYNYTKAIDSGLLLQEIIDSAIVEPVRGITPYDNGSFDVWFPNVLTAGDETILGDVVTAHVIPTTLPEGVESVEKLRAGNGNASAPPYAFTGDPTTGVFCITPGELRLSAGGVAAIYTTATTATFAQDVIVSGNLTVSGTQTTVNSTEVAIGDSIITLNSGEVGTPTQNGGIEIERGTSTNAQLVWDELNDAWAGGLVGSLVTFSVAGHTHTKSDITDFSEGDYATAGHTHTKSSITDFVEGDYATAAQGTLAASALQDITGETLTDLADVAATIPTDGYVLTYDTTNGWQPEALPASVTDHGLLTGLADDDHSIYHTDARGDARYNTKGEIVGFLAGKENTFAKNTAFNKDFGTAAGSVAEGNDARLSDARTPTTHTHVKADITDFNGADYATAAQGVLAGTALQDITGEVLSDLSNVAATVPTNGQVLTYNTTNGWQPETRSPPISDHGSLTGLADDDHTQYHTDARGDARYYTQAEADANLSTKENTFTKNTAFNKNFGTTAGTVTQGNDSRLSDARSPTTHTHTIANVTSLQTALDGKATAAQGTKADSASQPGHTHVKANITDFVEGDYATAAQGTKADSASQPGHTHTKANILDFTDGDYATAAQGILAGTASQPGHAHTTGDITSGTFANARISAASVTQHVGSIAHNSLSGYVANEHATPKNSLQITAGQLQFVNDLTSPGNNQVYGTNASGVKGWKADPAGGALAFTEKLTWLGGVTTTSTWQTITLPGSPANVIVTMISENPNNAAANMGIRAVGSAIDRQLTMGKSAMVSWTVKTNASGQVQIYSQSTGGAGFWFTGIFE